MMLVPRIIKSEKCKICKSYLPRLQKQGHTLLNEMTEKNRMSNDFFFFIYDADHPDNQKQLDDWSITDMPVIQIVDTETWTVKYSFPPGPLNVRSICGKIRELERKHL